MRAYTNAVHIKFDLGSCGCDDKELGKEFEEQHIDEVLYYGAPKCQECGFAYDYDPICEIK